MRQRLAGLAILAAVLSGCGGHHRRSLTPAKPAVPVSDSVAGRLSRQHPCPGAPGFTCAQLAVPLDHAGQVPGRLTLQVAVQNRGAAPRGDLIFLTGGPGQPGVPFVNRIAARLKRALGGYRLVMFDQRGTGRAALQCPALQAAAGDSDLIDPPPGVIEGCARAIGPARRFYTTAETVADLEALRGALRAPTITIDGVSYGTLVAERYALRYPGRVARLVLDSVVPQSGVDPLYAAALPAAARVLRSVCAQQRCSWDPAADVARIVRARRDGPALLRALVAESVEQPAFPGVLAALHAATRGDSAQLGMFITNGGLSYGVPASALSQGLHESTLCLDLAAPWDAAAPAAERSHLLDRLTARLSNRATYPFDRATARDNGLVQGCLRWPATAAPAVTVGGLSRRLPPVPVLLLAGGYDLSTPLAWARQELASAPHGRLVVVPAAGHSVQLRGGPAALAALVAFLQGT